MKWIKLKIYKGEDLLSEVEQVESKYDNLINEVRCANINDNKAKIEFLSFREEIEQRIIELDEFYQLNITDSRIGIFEKVRNRLYSLLEINIDEGNKVIQKNYGRNNEISITGMDKFGFNPRKASPKKSKLFMTSSAMRHSSIRKSGTIFAE